VCYEFKGQSEITDDIYTIIKNFQNEQTFTKVYPNFDLSYFENFIKKIKIFNNLILYEQIKTINESIKMVNSKDTYLQNLILGIFMENKNPVKLYFITLFKNILGTRIKKCINFLRTYNINHINESF